jgi:hypothetical protein
MYSKSQFCALEAMCRQRATVAQKEMEYWLNEADEWTKASAVAPLVPALHTGEPDTEKTDTSPSLSEMV